MKSGFLPLSQAHPIKIPPGKHLERSALNNYSPKGSGIWNPTCPNLRDAAALISAQLAQYHTGNTAFLSQTLASFQTSQPTHTFPMQREPCRRFHWGNPISNWTSTANPAHRSPLLRNTEI